MEQGAGAANGEVSIEIGDLLISGHTFTVLGRPGGRLAVYWDRFEAVSHDGVRRVAGTCAFGSHPVEEWLYAIDKEYNPKWCPLRCFNTNGQMGDQPLAPFPSFDPANDPAHVGNKQLHVYDNIQQSWRYVGMAYENELPFDVYMRQVKGGRTPNWCPFDKWRPRRQRQQRLVWIVKPVEPVTFGFPRQGRTYFPVLDKHFRFMPADYDAPSTDYFDGWSPPR